MFKLTKIIFRCPTALSYESNIWKTIVLRQRRHYSPAEPQPSAKNGAGKGPGSSSSSSNNNNTGRRIGWQLPILAGAGLASGTLIYAYKSGAFNWFLDSTGDEEQQVPSKSEQQRATPSPTLPKLDLPGSVKYLLIGAGTASFAAFRAIRGSDPRAQVLVIGDEDYYPYMRPPLSKELWFNEDLAETKRLQFQQWNGKRRSVFFEHEDFYCPAKDLLVSENGCVAVVTGRKVIGLDLEKRRAYLNDGNEISFEKCLLATGGKPKNLPVFEKAPDNIRKKISLFRAIKDFKEIDELLKKVSSIAVIGGGFLGSELACALARRGKKQGLEVYQIFPENGNMSKVLPAYLSSWTTEKVAAEGVKVIPNALVQDATVTSNKINLKLSNGKEVSTNHAVVAVGLEPNTELAESSGLELDKKQGGFLVNSELEARSNVWAAGDVACFYDSKLGRRRIEHHDHAVVSGRLAGDNMTGAGKSYTHQSMFWSDLGSNVSYEAIGIVDSFLPTVAFFAKNDEKKLATVEVAQTNDAGDASTKDPTSLIPSSPSKLGQEYGKGVIFYMRDETIVGILLWNIFNRMPLARRILKEGRQYDDLNEVAKLFTIHEVEE